MSHNAGLDLLPVSFRERTTNINGSFVFGGLPAVTGVRDAVTPLQQFLSTEQRTIDPATGRPYSYSRFTQSIGAEYFEASTFNQGYFIQDDFRVNDRLNRRTGLSRAGDGADEALLARHVVPVVHHLSKADGAAFVNDFTGFGVFASPSDPLNHEVDRGPSDFDMRQRVTNRLNPTNVNRTWKPNATFNTVTGAETARQFQLAARFSF